MQKQYETEEQYAFDGRKTFLIKIFVYDEAVF